MSIEIRVHKASSGARWYKAGLDIFQRQPFIFMFMYMFIAAVGMLGFVLPLLKIPAALATPFLLAGFYQAALRRQKGHKVAFADILNVFSQQGRRMLLFRVGLYQMGAALLLGMVSSLLFADAVAVLSQPDIDPQVALQELAQSFSFPAVALILVLFSVYLCAFAFAVPLVYFGGHTSMWAVMKASLLAFYRNMAAMTVYGLIGAGLMLVCAILSLIPLLVVMPICYISLFIAFQAIFMPQLQQHEGDKGAVDRAQNEPAKPQESHSSDGRFDA
ncbi:MULTISPECIES: BPSS1780 family membrane protein [unclassified Pseudoalteromonas]|uniref:BPSS1780 family membrane protein n=1 Tax=unclassified Pseudoalteromonas TaxID=194690 RepID=UPI000CF5EA14|nr:MULTISPECIES: BPSS1780 family membrane protein [unclassified Pseudoalteromonas]